MTATDLSEGLKAFAEKHKAILSEMDVAVLLDAANILRLAAILEK